MAAQEATGIPASEFDDKSLILAPARGELLRVTLLGLAVGLLIPLLSFGLERFFIEPVFCRSGDGLNICASAAPIAYYVSSGLLTVIAVIVLANWQVFRPLLIAVAAAASLWGLSRYIEAIVGNNMVEYYAFSAGLYMVTYLLFYWAMRIRNFLASVILAVLLVIAVRWMLIS